MFGLFLLKKIIIIIQLINTHIILLHILLMKIIVKDEIFKSLK